MLYFFIYLTRYSSGVFRAGGGDRLKHEAGSRGKLNFGLQIYGFAFTVVTLLTFSMLKCPK